MARPVIALLTDFGTRDHYVGVMKGVILGICPEAALVDLTHDIAAQDVTTGALELAAAVPYFPTGSVFVAVVDPGVGSGRRALAVETQGRFLVGPDNGLLSLVFAGDPGFRAASIESPAHALPVVSRTFEGRDRFAPAAAWLATGVGLAALGPAVDDPLRLRVPGWVRHGDGLSGEVLRVDHFGNLITNIPRDAVMALGSHVEVLLGNCRAIRIVSTYAEARIGEVCALFSSSGHLEVAVREGSAALQLRAARGAPVQVHARSGA